MDLYLDIIDQRGIAYLHGYPSAIETLCRHIWRTGWQQKKPIRGVFPISEPLYAYQRDVISAALPNATIAPFYGLSERALFASEVEEDVYRFSFDGKPDVLVAWSQTGKKTLDASVYLSSKEVKATHIVAVVNETQPRQETILTKSVPIDALPVFIEAK